MSIIYFQLQHLGCSWKYIKKIGLQKLIKLYKINDQLRL